LVSTRDEHKAAKTRPQSKPQENKMTNRSRITAIIAAALITTATAAMAQGSAGSNSGATTLPGVGSQISGCDAGKSKGPLGY